MLFDLFAVDIDADAGGIVLLRLDPRDSPHAHKLKQPSSFMSGKRGGWIERKKGIRAEPRAES